ncbi:MAG: efflux RND transporter periplasmic adaptor subunit [Gemmatimonadaceae bacterium]
MRRLSALILLGAVTLAACAGAKDDEPPSGTARVVTGAKTAPVTEGPFAETIEATALVSGRPGHVAVLSAPSAARISAVHAVVGQRVAAGAALVELDQVAFHAAAQSADAALAAAEKNLARQQRLADAGITPRRDVELATAELASARATAETARRQSELSVLRAPIAGVVTLVSATLGATADPAQALVQVADGSALDVTFNVMPAQAARMRRGAAVQLFEDARASLSAIAEATIVAVGGAVDSATRSVLARAELTHATRTLQIGETLTARIVVSERAHALLVPVEALVPDGEGLKVFVVDANGIAHARAVEVRGRNDRVAEITKGLQAGESVVTYGAYGMDDSVTVARPTAAPARPAPDAK